jgi:hypothetical protein
MAPLPAFICWDLRRQTGVFPTHGPERKTARESSCGSPALPFSFILDSKEQRVLKRRSTLSDPRLSFQKTWNERHKKKMISIRNRFLELLGSSWWEACSHCCGTSMLQNLPPLEPYGFTRRQFYCQLHLFIQMKSRAYLQ